MNDKYKFIIIFFVIALLIIGFTTSMIPHEYSRSINKPSIFCGNGDILPSGYDALGTRFQCLKKGFGAGKYSQMRIDSRSVIIFSIVIFIGIIIAVGFLYMDYENRNRSEYHDDKNNGINCQCLK